MTDPTAGYHPRAMVLVRQFGPALRRASLIGFGAGVVAGLGLDFLLPAGTPWPLRALADAAAFAGVATGAAMALVPRRLGRAYAAFSWLGHRETARFRERTGSVVPDTAAKVDRWLAENHRAPATALARLELLVALGRLDAARAELASLPAPASDLDRLAEASLRQWLRFIDTGAADLAAFDVALEGLPAGSAVRLEADVVRATAETRLLAEAGDPDPLRPLIAVRPRLGREAGSIVVRDTWLRYVRQVAVLGLAGGLFLALMR